MPCDDKGGPLNGDAAKLTFAYRIGTAVDRVRGLATMLGARPYRVVLVWTRFTGAERGDGEEHRVHEIEVTPTPKVSDLTSIAHEATSVGFIPEGAIQVTEISIVRFTEDILKGRHYPVPHKDTPQPYDFFYEVFEDGRGDDPAQRKRFKLAADPFLDGENAQWVIRLERMTPETSRCKGASQYGGGDD